MSNTIDVNGLTLKTRAEIIDEILNGAGGFSGLYDIYGSDANLDPNTPDGNLVQLIAQLSVDYQELIQTVYDSFDPDLATGINLDLRCAINGVVRQPGTYSTATVFIGTDRAVTLTGLDDDPENPFTVSDGSGNQFFLEETQVIASAGSWPAAFRAAQIGAITVPPYYIGRVVTVTLGVTAVFNTAAATPGTDEESDYALRIRRSQSIALGSKGFLSGLYGAIGNVAGVTDVSIKEDLIAHTIWCVVAGGSDADVAQAIYVKRNAGVGMIGDELVEITQEDGTAFFVRFDRPITQNLWIQFNVTAVTGFVDDAAILAAILADLSYRIGASATASEITALVMNLYPNASVTDCGVGLNGSTFFDQIDPTGFQYQFAIASGRISINGS